ncbi:reverse transcriptase domain-containing protein [Tanacetum coccineum]
MDTRRGKGIPRHEAMYSGTANGNRTKTQRRANNVPLCSQRSGQCSPTNRKRLTPNVGLLCQSRPADSKSKLQFNGETGLSLSTCHKEVEEILPGTSDSSGYRPTNQPDYDQELDALMFEFDASNNEAEYEALVAGLRIAEQMGIENLVAKVDSRLMANQINGSYKAKEQSMIQYLEKAKALISNFKMFSIEQAPYQQKRRGHGFGLSGEIISDNGKQFRDNPFKDWCEKLNIKQRFASVKHPQTNGQVERANRSLGEGIKSRLGEDNKNWVEEVSHVLWAHLTMIKTSNGDTPFSLTYGTEVVIPVEIRMPSLRCAEVNQAENDKGLLLNLDMLEERREKVTVREVRSKEKMEKYYNAKVCSTTFRPGDFVYRSNEASHAKENGKLGPKWEGPYEVVEALGKGAYKLRNGSGDILPRTWNVKDLKKCYL